MQNDSSKCPVHTKPASFHFIGIGGIGMSALARVLLDQKIRVKGSDAKGSPITEALSKKGAIIFEGHQKEHVDAEDIVIVSSGIKNTNPELLRAKELNCKILHRSDLLNRLMNQKKALAVAGMHGKTTTSSLLTAVLVAGYKDPSFAVGGVIHQFSTDQDIDTVNGRHGQGEYFVAEADESDGTFLKYFPHAAIITNAEGEHLDHYKSVDNVYKAFQQFFTQVKEESLLFYCGDDEHLTEINKQVGKGISYGFSKENKLYLFNFKQNGWSISYSIQFEGKQYDHVEVALTGEHNALNSAAVFGMALKLGVEEDRIREAFIHFKGVGRRCQKKGEVNNILVLDDYGHHPTEVKKTILAVKSAAENRRLVVVFQPHRYTRTKDFFKEFSEAFDGADLVYITDIYSAGEDPIEGISHHSIIEHIQRRKSVACNYLPKENWLSLLDKLQPQDVVLTLGAGTITHLGPELIKALNQPALC